MKVSILVWWTKQRLRQHERRRASHRRTAAILDVLKHDSDLLNSCGLIHSWNGDCDITFYLILLGNISNALLKNSLSLNFAELDRRVGFAQLLLRQSRRPTEASTSNRALARLRTIFHAAPPLDLLAEPRRTSTPAHWAGASRMRQLSRRYHSPEASRASRIWQLYSPYIRCELAFSCSSAREPSGNESV